MQRKISKNNKKTVTKKVKIKETKKVNFYVSSNTIKTVEYS